MDTDFIFFTWFVLSFVIAAVGNSRKIGFWRALILSLILSPISGLIVVSFSEKSINKEDKTVKYKESLESARRCEYKGKTEEALDHYMDTLFFLETYSLIIPEDNYTMEKAEEIEKIKNTIKKVKSKVDELQKG